jgi:hypothetical protein
MRRTRAPMTGGLRVIAGRGRGPTSTELRLAQLDPEKGAWRGGPAVCNPPA